jgi:hypothetical protein
MSWTSSLGVLVTGGAEPAVAIFAVASAAWALLRMPRSQVQKKTKQKTKKKTEERKERRKRSKKEVAIDECKRGVDRMLSTLPFGQTVLLVLVFGCLGCEMNYWKE